MPSAPLLPAQRLLPDPDLSAENRHRMVELAEHRMLSPARRAGYELRLAGATVLPQRQTIAKTEWGTWMFVDHVDDPTAKGYDDKIPIPSEQIARLAELSKLGVRPDEAWILHELPKTYQIGDPLPQLVPPPRELREKDERLQLRLAAAAKMLFTGMAATLTAAATAPLAVVGAAAGLAGLDPVILGGVRHPELPIVQWCVLAQWEWE